MPMQSSSSLRVLLYLDLAFLRVRSRKKNATTLRRNIIVITTRVNGVEVAASRRTALKHVHGVE
jgi:hypothetical protein